MRRNPIVVGLAIILGLGLFMLFVVLPRGAEATSIKEQIASEQDRLAAAQADVAALKAAQQQGTAAEDLAGIRKAIPSTPDLPNLLAALEAAAADAGVGLGGVSPGIPTASAAGSASVIPLSISVSGDYFALARFIFDLENQERLAKINSISISGGADGPLAMQVAAEVYTTDLSAGPGSDPAPGPEVGA